MLCARYMKDRQRIVDLLGQVDLDSLAAGLDTVDGPVVQGDPVGEDTVCVESMKKEKGFSLGRQSQFSLDFTDFCFQP